MAVSYSFDHDALYLYYPFLKMNISTGWTESTLAAKRDYFTLTAAKTAKLDESLFINAKLLSEFIHRGSLYHFYQLYKEKQQFCF